MVHVLGNPGPGGWGSILMYKGNKKEISGGNANTTNNIMEITAVIEGLKLLKYPCTVKVYSDSAYVVNCFNQGWIYNWLKKGWKTANNEPVKNEKLFDTEIATINIYASANRNIATLIEAAALNTRLKRMGKDSDKELANRIINMVTEE
jgi:ribonuclease HI